MIKKIGLSYIILTILIIITSMAVAILLKADVGVGAWDALVVSLSRLTKIKIGTMGIILNFSCILGQIFILKKKFKKISFLQIPISILLGVVINFFFYTIFKNVVFNNYIIRIIVCALMTTFVASAVGGIVVLGIATFPTEGLCLAIYEKTKISFAKLRQWMDILSVLFSILLTLVFSLEWSIREGTIINMIIFAPTMGKVMPILEKLFIKWGVIDKKLN